MEREQLKSRMGFILLSAGCAIGIGNVWRFPYVVGNNGGGIFVLFYIIFLMIIGIPIMTMEFAVGRASNRTVVTAFDKLEKKGAKWHYIKGMALAGNYLLMMFYTTVAGWMLYYFYSFIIGKFDGAGTEDVGMVFEALQANPFKNVLFMVIIVVTGMLVCSIGLQKGVERISKVMMMALLVIMVGLAINSFFIEGGREGIKFYLYPDINRVKEIGISSVIVQAMNQAMFTLSLGMGSMTVFGSYLKKDRSLFGESVNIAVLDTFVALIAGFIIFPACFAYGVNPDSGPSLIFVTLPNIFVGMPGGRILGMLFFLFMTFAAFSTVIAVFENIIACNMDLWGAERKKVCYINIIIIILLSIPCALGFNVLSGIQPLGEGSTILDFEDFIVSSFILPLGSIIYLLFCVSKWGWGFENYFKEVNTGKGIKIPRIAKIYLLYILPVIMIGLFINGLINM